jgi:hypothetical protein
MDDDEEVQPPPVSGRGQHFGAEMLSGGEVSPGLQQLAGYGGPEGLGMHTVSAPGGRAGHGADIPGSGWPGPGSDTPGGDDWGAVPVSSGPRDWSPTGGGSAAAGDFGGVE